jgi:hypothetical protein
MLAGSLQMAETDDATFRKPTLNQGFADHWKDQRAGLS